MKSPSELIVEESQALYWADDGLYTPEVGAWPEEKYRIVHLYNQLFARGMKRRWDRRIYIDLFAGAGKARIRKTNKIVLASPMLALNIPDKYNQYIFCDKSERNVAALKQRVEREYPNMDAHFIVGDCNRIVDSIISLIPRASGTSKVLSFCFVDPFSLDIHFETIRKLGTRFVDFLILLALSMDAQRNESVYVEENNTRIDKFLDLADWRARWERAKQKRECFRRFLAKEYANQMIALGYRRESVGTMVEMRSDEKNLPLYHLAFFSRHQKGYDFWREVRKYTSQPSLPFE